MKHVASVELELPDKEFYAGVITVKFHVIKTGNEVTVLGKQDKGLSIKSLLGV